jgi:hypothetical protein
MDRAVESKGNYLCDADGNGVEERRGSSMASEGGKRHGQEVREEPDHVFDKIWGELTSSRER